jgi:hypothetical protein
MDSSTSILKRKKDVHTIDVGEEEREREKETKSGGLYLSG